MQKKLFKNRVLEGNLIIYRVDMMRFYKKEKVQAYIAAGGLFYDLRYIHYIISYVESHPKVDKKEPIYLAVNRIKDDIEAYMTSFGFYERNWLSKSNQKLLEMAVKTATIEKIYQNYILPTDIKFNNLKNLFADKFSYKGIFPEMYLRGGFHCFSTSTSKSILLQSIIEYIDYKRYCQNTNNIIDELATEIEMKNSQRVFPYQNIEELITFIEKEMI